MCVHRYLCLYNSVRLSTDRVVQAQLEPAGMPGCLPGLHTTVVSAPAAITRTTACRLHWQSMPEVQCVPRHPLLRGRLCIFVWGGGGVDGTLNDTLVCGFSPRVPPGGEDT